MIALVRKTFSEEAVAQAIELGRFLRTARSRSQVVGSGWMRRVVSLESVAHQFETWDPNRSDVQTEAQAKRLAISDDDCIRIRESDEPADAWAERLGVCKTTVVKARLGYTHKHLPGAKRPRSMRGAFNHSARLTEAMVLDILASPLTNQEAADAWGVSRSCIDAIRRGITWPHVDRSGALTNEERARLRRARLA